MLSLLILALFAAPPEYTVERGFTVQPPFVVTAPAVTPAPKPAASTPAPAPHVETSDRKAGAEGASIGHEPRQDCRCDACACVGLCLCGAAHGGPSTILDGKGEKVRVIRDKAAEPPKVALDFKPGVVKPPVVEHGAHFSIKNADGTPYKLPAPVDARQWFDLGGQYAGYQGYGWLSATGDVLVQWHCKTGSTEVRPGLPIVQPAASFFAPPALGGCSGGASCGAAGFQPRGLFRFGGGFR